VKLRDGELQLAERLIDELSHPEFKPEQYQDQYRDRVLEMVDSKVEGKEITTQAPEAQRAQVIDLMDALKQSLAKRAAAGDETPAVAKKPPVKAPKRATSEDKDRKAQAGRK
jgi:DNA end-binding protein Ku